MRRLGVTGLRGRLLTVLLFGSIVVVAALIAGFNLVLTQRLNSDADHLLRQRATDKLATVATVGGHLRISETLDAAAVDTQTWVFAGARTLEQPRAPVASQRAARGLAGGPRRYITVNASNTRLYAVPVEASGRRLGTLVVGVSLGPYKSTAHTALVASVILGVLVIVVVAVAGWWVIAGALRPVARMTASAADWSEHDLDRRFVMGEPRDELTALAATFDRLLDRMATALRHEQRLTAEVSHELRTPLSKVLAEAELALSRERTPAEYRSSLESIQRSAQQLTRALDALLAAARAGATGPASGDAGEIAADARSSCEPIAAERGIAVEVTGPEARVRVAADRDIAERALAPLVENACRHARSEVSVRIERHDGEVFFDVRDDGPGVAANERDRIFDPGYRGGAANGNEGAGLGLALARRLAQAAGGEVEYREAPGGLFRLRLPAIRPGRSR